jgi:hypothetical protein
VADATGTSRPPFDVNLFKAYEDGKQRRYNLLFAVHGGAFVLAKLMTPEKPSIGWLTIRCLAGGMVLFTGLMGRDIWTFGEKMRGVWILTTDPAVAYAAPFGDPGKRVLFGLCGLLVLAWVLAAI